MLNLVWVWVCVFKITCLYGRCERCWNRLWWLELLFYAVRKLYLWYGNVQNMPLICCIWNYVDDETLIYLIWVTLWYYGKRCSVHFDYSYWYELYIWLLWQKMLKLIIVLGDGCEFFYHSYMYQNWYDNTMTRYGKLIMERSV